MKPLFCPDPSRLAAGAALRAHEAAGLGLASITVAELSFGVHKGGSARNIAALMRFLEPLEIADFDRAAALACGRLRATLQAAGSPLCPPDTQIAAHALALDVTLVTHNTGEFKHVPGLRLSDGLAAPDLCVLTGARPAPPRLA